MFKTRGYPEDSKSERQLLTVTLESTGPSLVGLDALASLEWHVDAFRDRQARLIPATASGVPFVREDGQLRHAMVI